MVGFAAERRPFLWTYGEGKNDEDDPERLKVRVVVMVGPPFGSSSPTPKGGDHGNVHASGDNVSMPMNLCWGGELFAIAPVTAKMKCSAVMILAKF